MDKVFFQVLLRGILLLEKPFFGKKLRFVENQSSNIRKSSTCKVILPTELRSFFKKKCIYRTYEDHPNQTL